MGKMIIHKCAWCDFKSNKLKLKMHIKNSHNKNLMDYLLKINGLSEVPKCPNCGKSLGISKRDKFSLLKYCSKSCQMSYLDKIRIDSGDFHLLHKNLKLDSDGKSISHSKSQLTLSKESEHHFQSKNLKRDENGKVLIRKLNKDKIYILYLGYLDSENLIKIGMTCNIKERLKLFSESGINFNKILIIEGDYNSINSLETTLHRKFKEFNKPLNIEKFPNSDFMRLGHTEYFDNKISDELLNYLSDKNLSKY